MAGNKINVKHLIVIILIAGWLYSVARCRTAVYAILMLVILVILYKLFPNIYKVKFTKILFISVPFVLSYITYISVKGLINYHPAALELDKLLSTRLSARSYICGAAKTNNFWAADRRNSSSFYG